MCFDISNRLGTDQECVRQTDMALAIARANDPH